MTDPGSKSSRPSSDGANAPAKPFTITDGQRKVRSFVLRQGRFTEAQQRAFDTLWPRFGLDYAGMPRDFDAAFGGIKIFFPIPEDEFNNLVTQTKNQFQMVKNRFETTIGYELFKKESIKDLMVKYTYIMKFEKHIIRWMFIFYKPTQGWLLNWFHWDDKIDALFNEPLENNKK